MKDQQEILFIQTPALHWRVHIWWNEWKTHVAISWLTRMGLQSVQGVAARFPADEVNWREGIQLALRRALHEIPRSVGASSASLRRAFYQSWPEAHPEYRVKKAQRGWDVAARDGEKTVLVNADGGRIVAYAPIMPHGERPYHYVKTGHFSMTEQEVREGRGHVLCISAVCPCSCIGCRNAHR